ncbi:MAG TPA: arginine repressor [Acidimicrobiia bacterium]|jgi:transcriptional regulator of arginine metabolism|nr:arginine repressor [Acidimicrobiia bacterium]
MPRHVARRRLIRTLLRRRRVTSQGQLRELLRSAGHRVTQATVSRDLRTLGAIKDAASRYVITEELGSDSARGALARTLSTYAKSMIPSGNLVVVRTTQGAGYLVSAALEVAALDEVIGTVAGDDTCLVVTDDSVGGEKLARLLDEMGATA